MPISGGPKNIMHTEMHKFKEGTLHSGKSKQPVKSRAQAIAIGLSEARKAGGKIPKPKHDIGSVAQVKHPNKMGKY